MTMTTLDTGALISELRLDAEAAYDAPRVVYRRPDGSIDVDRMEWEDAGIRDTVEHFDSLV